jgi:calcineurin-like phosphoesterase family protein
LENAQKIAACTFSFLQSANHVFILVSGDIAFSGQLSQYTLAKKFFEQLRNCILNETECPVTFILVPGNHDCDFNSNNNARKMLIKQLIEHDSLEVDESVIASCTNIQSAFFNFRNALEENTNMEDDQIWRTSSFEVEGKIIVFDCLNISWVSQLNEEQGNLYFPVDRYFEKKSSKVDVRLVVMHHPLNWFNQQIYQRFKKFVRQIANIVISGHEHQGNVGINEDAYTDKSAFVEGCVLQDNEKNLSGSSFNIIILDLDKMRFSSTCFGWNVDHYAPTEEGSWSDYHQLPEKQRNLFVILTVRLNEDRLLRIESVR